MMVFPAMASVELVVLGSFWVKTRAPVARLKATNLPLTRVVNTRLLEIVIAPTGSVSTFVLHSMAPVVAFSARTAPLAFAADGGAPFTWTFLVKTKGTL